MAGIGDLPLGLMNWKKLLVWVGVMLMASPWAYGEEKPAPEAWNFVIIKSEAAPLIHIPWKDGLTVLDCIARLGGFSWSHGKETFDLVRGGEIITRGTRIRELDNLRVERGDFVIVHGELVAPKIIGGKAKTPAKPGELFDPKKRYDLHFPAGSGNFLGVTPVRRIDTDWYLFHREGKEIVVNLRTVEYFSESEGE